MLPRAVAVALIGLAGGDVAAQTHTPLGPAPERITPAVALFVGAPMVTIARDGLSVTVAVPDAARGFYRSTRFDWSGMIVAARLRGARFYGPWFDGTSPDVRDVADTAAGVVVGPPNAGTGTAEEFANRDGETVPGYNATPVGGTFVKIGVGRLRRPDAQPYDHFRPYEIVDGGRWTVRRTNHAITFRQRLAPDATGYGFEYEKTLTLLPGGGMTIAHRLRNLGSKPIATQIYTHNFARFDDAEIGPGVSLDFPFALAGPSSREDLAGVDGGTLRYRRALRPGDRVQLPVQPGGAERPAGPFRVTGANGASITMTAPGPLVRTAIWSMRRTVAVEPFVPIAVAPGGEQRWEWHYRFETGR